MQGNLARRRILGGLALALGCGGGLEAGAQALVQKNAVRMTVSERTVSQEKGVKQQVPRGTTQSLTEGVSQVISLQRMDATLPETLSLEWVVVVETAEGRRGPADTGTKEIALPIGRPVEFLTPPVSLVGRTWRGKKGGTIQDHIVAVAVRLRKEDGTIVAESYRPKDIEPKVDDWMAQGAQPGGPADGLRARKRLLRGPGAPDAPPPPGE